MEPYIIALCLYAVGVTAIVVGLSLESGKRNDRLHVKSAECEGHIKVVVELESRIDKQKQALEDSDATYDTLFEKYKQSEIRATEATKFSEYVRGEMNSLKDTHLAEIENLQKVIDFLASANTGRQVFGKGPVQESRPDQEIPSGAMNGRGLASMLTQEFYERAEKAGMNLHENPDADMVNHTR